MHRSFSSIYLKSTVLLLCLTLSPIFLWGQSDTIWVGHNGRETFINHVVRQGETPLTLAKRYNAPVSRTVNMNHTGYNTHLTVGSIFKIPLGNYNYLQFNSVVDSRRIYYVAQDGERLKTISKIFKVSKRSLVRWNHLELPEIFAGQTIQVGWVRYNQPQKTQKDIEAPKKVLPANHQNPDSTKNRVIGQISEVTTYDTSSDSVAITAMGRKFQEITAGKILRDTSGAAVLFPVRSSNYSSTYYAFFDKAPRGAIISIFNPSSQQTIYAKVIGPLPKIGLYHNAIIGLSGNAAKALQARSQRIFCKVTY